MRIGIIGTNWGRMHVGGFRGAGAEVAGLCGKDLAHTRGVAAQEGIPLATESVRELSQAVDAVVVASPDALHVSHALEALEAGRHVLVEKPLAETEADAAALEARVAALPPGRVAAVNFPYRMLPPFQGLRRWLAGAPPARALDVTVSNGFVPVDGGGPGRSDFGGASHVLDAALWLLGGRPVWLAAALEGRPVHTAWLQARLDTGALLTVTHRPSLQPGIDGRWWLRGDGWEAELAGGYVAALNGWRIGPARVTRGGPRLEVLEVGPLAEPRPGEREPWAQAHVETARAFLAKARGEAAPDLATIAEGARVQRLLAAAGRADREGRRVPCAG